jgi:flagellar biosynthetic protein FliR
MTGMKEISDLSPYLMKFVLVLLRISMFMAMLPFFSSKNFPMQFRIGLAVAVAVALAPVVQADAAGISMPVLVMREFVFGMLLGGMARGIFFAVDMAGQMISNMIGFSMATIFNPEMGQSTEVARIYGIIAMLVMLAVDAHHDLIAVLVQSYEWAPVGQVDVRTLVVKAVTTGSKLFITGMKIAAPVIVGMLITNILMGFLYKAAPQVNIFFVSMPVHIALGFLIMIMMTPVFVHFFPDQFSEVRGEMFRILALARK